MTKYASARLVVELENYGEGMTELLTERLPDVSRETYLVCGVYAPWLDAELFHVKPEITDETYADK